MDTKRLEQIGESFIVHKLLDEHILVTKPLFEQLGADLIGFTSIDDKARFCRIQCKYRELKKATPVKIDSKYVVGAFILFLYIKFDGKRHYYCLLPKDIRRIFKPKKNVFHLNITRKVLTSLDNKKFIKFTKAKVAAISKLMKASSPNAELKRMISDLIEKFRNLSELRHEHEKLQQLIHELEVTNLKKKACKENLKILEEYAGFMKKTIKSRRKK